MKLVFHISACIKESNPQIPHQLSMLTLCKLCLYDGQKWYFFAILISILLNIKEITHLLICFFEMCILFYKLSFHMLFRLECLFLINL